MRESIARSGGNEDQEAERSGCGRGRPEAAVGFAKPVDQQQLKFLELRFAEFMGLQPDLEVI
jgi:hypothetical protein